MIPPFYDSMIAKLITVTKQEKKRNTKNGKT